MENEQVYMYSWNWGYSLRENTSLLLKYVFTKGFYDFSMFVDDGICGDGHQNFERMIRELEFQSQAYYPSKNRKILIIPSLADVTWYGPNLLTLREFDVELHLVKPDEILRSSDLLFDIILNNSSIPRGYIKCLHENRSPFIIPCPDYGEAIHYTFLSYALEKNSVSEIVEAVWNKYEIHFSKTAIHQILKNPVYCGMSPKGKAYTGVKPIVSKRLFDQAQEVRAKRHQKYFHKKKPEKGVLKIAV